MNVKGKKVLVIGYSKSGHFATELLLKKGATVLIYDDSGVTCEMPIGAKIISNLNEGIIEADFVVVSPAVRYDRFELKQARSMGKQVIGELELAYSFCDSEIVAITGTNGKTTTTLIITEILNRANKSAYALGNIGIAFSEKVLDLNSDDTAVVEVSSFQLESVKNFSPDIAVLLNLSPDHIDRHKTFDNYVNEKKKIFSNQISHDYAVINADDELCMKITENITAKKYYFSCNEKVRGAYVEEGNIFFEDKGKILICSVNELSLKGEHNLHNVLACVAVAMIMGVNSEIIRIVLKSFSTLKYRNEYIGEKQQKDFYNDSKGTNISATLASVKCMEGRTVLILGGSDKGEKFDTLFKNLPNTVVHIFVTGDNSPKIIESALYCGFYNISYRSTLLECVRESVCIHAENVLFSPASASFDRYRDYCERGRDFQRCFEELR